MLSSQEVDEINDKRHQRYDFIAMRLESQIADFFSDTVAEDLESLTALVMGRFPDEYDDGTPFEEAFYATYNAILHHYVLLYLGKTFYPLVRKITREGTTTL